MNPNLSALIDGELNSSELDEMLDQLCNDKSIQNQWHEAMNTRAVMREEYVVNASGNSVFTDKVAAAIEAEPTIVAPNALLSTSRESSNVIAFPATVRNNSKLPAVAMLAAAASFAALTFLNVGPLGTEQSASKQLASESSVEPTANFLAAEQEMQALVVAHGEFSSMAGLNGLTAYAKIVNADGAQ